MKIIHTKSRYFFTMLLLASSNVCFSQWNSSIQSPVLLQPNSSISNTNMANKFNLPTTNGGEASIAFLSNDWDLNNGLGLIVGANVSSPIAWMYGSAGRNAFTIAVKGFSGGQGAGVLGNYLTPLFQVRENGNVGIGTTNPDQRLTVNGKIKAEEIQVVVDVPADYVFNEGYELKPLEEIEQFIRENKHLPGVPNAETLKANGWQVGEMNNKLLEKVEELTLYLIALKKENEALKERIEKLEER